MVQPTSNRVERRRIIERPRLTRLLDETDARIILLVAPAGYGKSTLARQWLGRSSQHAVTLRAQSGAQDTAGVARAIALAASRHVTGAGERLIRRLQLVSAPTIAPTEMADLLAEDLYTWPPDAWILIEDLHWLSQGEPAAFVARLIDRTPARFLLTSRFRPVWIDPRRILYGEIAEIDRETLSFTEEETSALLERHSKRTITELLALSSGWPAVLGLAALSADPLPTLRDVPFALYDYFADELYQHASPALRHALHALAAADEINTALLRRLYGPRAAPITKGAVEAGFLQITSADSMELHPLLRTFLLRRAPPDQVRASARRVAEHYLETGAWDSAFTTIQRFSLRELLDDLMRLGLDDCLAHGRLTTIKGWLNLAHAWELASPIRDIAEAEYAFRRGDNEYTASRMEAAIPHLERRTARLAHAYYRLGQARQFLSQSQAAMLAYNAAKENAVTPDGRRAALWGGFTLACETDGRDLTKYLRDFRRTGALGSDDLLRLATGHVALEIRHGNARRALAAAERSGAELDRATDPLIKTSFLNALVNLYAVRAEYAEALSASRRQLSEARAFRLHFVIPHALLNRATANAGLGRVTEAIRAIDEAEREHGIGGDTFAEANVATLRAKLSIADDRLASARELLAARSSMRTGTTLDAEVASLLALVNAALGHFDEAREWVSSCREMNHTFDAWSITAWALAVCALAEAKDPAPALALFDDAVASVYLEPLVCAYRAFPPLLAPVISSEGTRFTAVRRVLARTNDLRLLERLPSAAGQIATLSPRELEVSVLLAQGLSNREIATALSISEGTAKVHVRHILGKLGTRSRTQAALLLIKQGFYA